MAGFSRSVLQPLLEGAALEEGEEMDYSVENVACSILRDEDDDDDELKEPEFWGCGTLSVTTTRVLWRRTEAAPEAHADAMAAFAVQVKHVGLHAVTRDPETFASPCLYAQLLLDEFEGESNEPAELYLAPRNVKQLPELFAAFSKAAELNPDTDDDEDDDDLVMNGVLGGGGDDDEPRAALDSQAMMDRFDAMLNVGDYARRPPEDEQDGQFDDAENDCAEANDYE